MIAFDNSYARLPPRFFVRQMPEPVSAPALIRVNTELARQLGIDPDWLASADGIAMVAGNRMPAGCEPIATVYAGHQFGHWNPQLGDGRALLLGEVLTADGSRFDLQLKGSGRTPYSRQGDGRAPLGPVLREYILGEAMAALGVATSRCLAAVSSGDTVYREGALPGAVLLRVARSHIRIGTLQFFAARQDTEAVQQLAEHVIARHYPAAAGQDNPVQAMLQAVVAAQAELIASWQLLGFIHGVMNTDNMLLSGETIDYGPCAFMDAFDPDAVFSSIDHNGRYAYRRQPAIAHWNLACLAQTLLPLLHADSARATDIAQQTIDQFPDLFLAAHRVGMGKKLGIALRDDAADEQLVRDLLALMAQHRCDFTLTFRHLADLADPDSSAPSVGELIQLPAAMQAWLARWRLRAAAEPTDAACRQRDMYAVNPALIPRNHQVETCIEAAIQERDFTPFATLTGLLTQPFCYRAELASLALPPKPEQVVQQTFCGT